MCIRDRYKQGVAETFDSAAFDRHMDKLRAQKELEKTDPLRALVNKMHSDDAHAAKMKQRTPSTDDNTNIHSPFHPSQGVNIGEQGAAEAVGSEWHGSDTDREWYDEYKNAPVRVKVKNTSGMGGQPAGTYNVRSFTKTAPNNAEFTVTHQGGTMTGSLDLDNPKTYVDKNYDRKYAYDFYSGRMPITPRQAFNLMQVKKFTAKDDADAKRIAAGHGAKSVIKLRGGVPAGKIAEGWKDKVAGAALAGSMAMGGAPAHAGFAGDLAQSAARGLGAGVVAGAAGPSIFKKQNAADLAFAEQIPDAEAKAKFLKAARYMRDSRNMSTGSAAMIGANAFDEARFKKLKQKLATQYNIQHAVQESAPPGAKAERMVKHIKAGYAKDGKLTPKKKSIAYATAWKSHNKGKAE